MTSEAPFRPLNPWGRAMPKVKKRAAPDALYQVRVDTAAGETLDISPKFQGDDGKTVCEQLCEAANTSIIKRIRPEWLTAYIVKHAFVPH
jgi:hypothetical protein